MQFAKDSFYMALRDRLAALNPNRTVTLSGATRPAVIVAENELVIPIEPLPDAFYLEWGAAKAVAHHCGYPPLMEMACTISHHTFGTCDSAIDRGRTLAALDSELLSICQVAHTAKRDYTQSPSVDLGTSIFWLGPFFGDISGSEGRNGGSMDVRLERKATVRVFFFPEVGL
jgi:hypothetical protein